MPDELPVMVTVTGVDEGDGRITLSTRGELTNIPGGFSLCYEETSPYERQPTQTLVECADGRVTVLRTGSVVSTVVYTENETFVSEYGTPMGPFRLRVYATEVRVRRRGGMGHIRLAYQVTLTNDLSVSGETAMRRLDIRFTPCRS